MFDPLFVEPWLPSAPDPDPLDESSPPVPESEVPSLVTGSSLVEVPVTDREICEVPGEISASVKFSATTTAPSPIPKAATPIVSG